MAPSTEKPLGIYALFYLPVVSLSLLTGFTFSLALRAAFGLLLPAMEFAAAVNCIPNMLNYLLGWVTPPCLFVLMNGIIVILSASSGMFKRPVSDEKDDFVVCTEGYAPKLQSLEVSEGEILMEMSPGYGECELPDARGRHKTEENRFFQVEGDEEGKEECHVGSVQIEDNEEKCNEAEDGPQEGPKEEEQEEDEYYELHDAQEEQENGRRLLRESLASKSFSIAESRVLRGVGGGHGHVTHPFLRSKSIKRSFSIDSCPYNDNQPIPSIEELSDEAFKNRVEDFISRMNAKLRNELRK